jgi:hypothetical protein
MFITSSELQLHRQMNWRHTPRTPQDLQGTPDNYPILSSIGFNKTSVTCKAKIKESLTWFDYDKPF